MPVLKWYKTVLSQALLLAQEDRNDHQHDRQNQRLIEGTRAQLRVVALFPQQENDRVEAVDADYLEEKSMEDLLVFYKLL